ncbi:MAG: GDSL-type esterase/lipase family protein [Bacteroidota bacterium]
MTFTDDPHFYDVEIAHLKEKIQQLERPAETTAFYGSSSFRLWLRMEEDLAPLDLINLGFGGSSFLWCMHHFPSLFSLFTPKQFVLYIGDNDLGQGVAKEEVVDRFYRMRAMVWDRFPGIKIHFVSIKPSPARDYLIPTIKWVNAQLREEVESHPDMEFINIYDSMLEQGHHPSTAYYLSDLLHLNKRGYVVWRERFREHFQLTD